MMYFDNAATSFPKPKCVSDSVIYAINNLGSSGRGSYDLALNASRTIYDTRCKLAELFNINDPLDIALTTNATESLNMAINSLIEEKDHVITTNFEHNSVLRPLYKIGCELSFLEFDENFNLNYKILETLVQKNTKAIIVTHASNLTGEIVDLKLLSDFCINNNLFFVIDAAQTAGILDIDINEYNPSYLCFSGHKGLMGLQGTGGIYKKKEVPSKSLKVGGSGSETFSKNHPSSMPDIFEAGTANVHGAAALSASVKYILELSPKAIYKRELELTKYFYSLAKNIKHIKIYGNFSEGRERLATIAFNIGDLNASEVCSELFEKHEICARDGFHCAPLAHAVLGTTTQSIIRFSFSYFNTKQEIDTAIYALDTIANSI